MECWRALRRAGEPARRKIERSAFRNGARRYAAREVRLARLASRGVAGGRRLSASRREIAVHGCSQHASIPMPIARPNVRSANHLAPIRASADRFRSPARFRGAAVKKILHRPDRARRRCAPARAPSNFHREVGAAGTRDIGKAAKETLVPCCFLRLRKNRCASSKSSRVKTDRAMNCIAPA